MELPNRTAEGCGNYSILDLSLFPLRNTNRPAATSEAAELRTRLAAAGAQAEHLSALLNGDQDRQRQHVQLSSYIGSYTSKFLENKSPQQRAALRESIRATTKSIWDDGQGGSWENTTRVIRAMMAQHGFVFREPGEGIIGWDGYATKVPDVGTVEQLDRIVRTHRAELGAVGWYLNELTAVLYRVAKYLDEC